mmetsp:Transcript_2314/g.4705  ORF Transcript_2314/g.4705 Transcript_2314/m.4705 type:complete len:330 (-) Transcript_2314:48-1037(-)
MLPIGRCYKRASQERIEGSRSAAAALERSSMIASTSVLQNESSRDQATVVVALNRPKRPLSAYNLFFQATRLAMVKEKKEALNQQNKSNPTAGPKVNGKVVFSNMAKAIAKKWKAADATTRQPFEAMAAKETARYKREMVEYNKILRAEMKKRKAATSNKKPKQRNGMNRSIQNASTPHHGKNAAMTTMDALEPLPMFDSSYSSEENKQELDEDQGLDLLVEINLEGISNGISSSTANTSTTGCNQGPNALVPTVSLPSLDTSRRSNINCAPKRTAMSLSSYEREFFKQEAQSRLQSTNNPLASEPMIHALAQKLESDCVDWIIDTFRE